MTNGGDKAGRLAQAVREVKNRLADRDDVVVELREASRVRLEMLAAELAPVFAEVPDGVDFFDFAVSSGLQPRLWVDAVAHVDLARDRRTYRFVRDTRLGPVVLAENHATAPVVEAVTAYVAERLVERERALEGVGLPAPAPREAVAQTTTGSAPADEGTLPEAPRRSGFAAALGVLALGGLFGLGLAVVLFWDQLAH
jgi:hypothetical protein